MCGPSFLVGLKRCGRREPRRRHRPICAVNGGARAARRSGPAGGPRAHQRLQHDADRVRGDVAPEAAAVPLLRGHHRAAGQAAVRPRPVADLVSARGARLRGHDRRGRGIPEDDRLGAGSRAAGGDRQLGGRLRGAGLRLSARGRPRARVLAADDARPWLARRGRGPAVAGALPEPRRAGRPGPSLDGPPRCSPAGAAGIHRDPGALPGPVRG